MSYFNVWPSCSGAMSSSRTCMVVTVNAFSAGMKRKLTRQQDVAEHRSRLMIKTGRSGVTPIERHSCTAYAKRSSFHGSALLW